MSIASVVLYFAVTFSIHNGFQVVMTLDQKYACYFAKQNKPAQVYMLYRGENPACTMVWDGKTADSCPTESQVYDFTLERVQCGFATR